MIHPSSTCLRVGCWAVLVFFFTLTSAVSPGQCTFPASRSGLRVNYSFEPIFADGKMSLRVTLEFQGRNSGKGELELPASYAGQTGLTAAFTELKALSEQTTVMDGPSPSKKLVRFRPNALVRISYVLVKDWDGPLDSGTRFCPILQSNYFQILSDTALVQPKIDRAAVADVHFDWQKLPLEWSLATSFGTDDRCQSFYGTWVKVQTALFVGGDYRIHHSSVAGRPVIMAIRGKWSFTDASWMDLDWEPRRLALLLLVTRTS